MNKLIPDSIPEVANKLKEVVNRTPVATSRTLNSKVGSEVFVKCENFQRVGAFKFRGAYNALSRLSEDQIKAGVITHSSGNHAQGLALASKLLNIQAVIVMPEDAPPNKRAATAGYGAEIITCQAVEREKVTADLIERNGYTLIHPYDNDDIILGQGSAAFELFDEVGPLDYLLVPVGGGGLISGSALAAASLSPQCKVIGVEPEIADDANRSWRAKQIVTLEDVPDTIADGLRTRSIGRRNLQVMSQYVHEMLTVSEEEIIEALHFIWNYLKIVVEPSAAVALAPLLSGQINEKNLRIGAILSGGNISFPGKKFGKREKDAEKSPLPLKKNKEAAVSTSERPRVLIIDQFDSSAIDILQEVADVDVHLELSRDELLEKISDYEALIIGPDRNLNEQVFGYGFKLRAIGCPSAQLDNIDVSAARDLGIEVCYVPGGNAVAIAEHMFSQMMRLSIQYSDGRLSGKTLGLIGYGKVGRQIVKRAKAFDMNVVVNQPRLTPELAFSENVEALDLVKLLQQSDFVSIHVRFKTETESIIGASELLEMKKSAFLINTGHTDLVDEKALLAALDSGRIAGAALSFWSDEAGDEKIQSSLLRRHERTIIVPHVTKIIDQQRRNLALVVAREISHLLKSKQASDALSLNLVPIAHVTPHEEIDEKRVSRLMGRLEQDGLLVNPPITTIWKGQYIVLDGATRYSSFQRLGYQYIIVQVVESQQQGFDLHTWYHAVSHENLTWEDLREEIEGVRGLRLITLSGRAIRSALKDSRTLCYFVNRDKETILAQKLEGFDRLGVMKDLVNVYSAWGDVERTLVTDIERLTAQFPNIQAVAIYPQFKAAEVFDAATAGNFLPAGLTRFVIPGRILRLNADLKRLKKDEPLQEKQAWLNKFLSEKLSRSRMRYYQEPVILLDE